jgi:pyruvate dehydrogenase E2 component (dihydrolipoamide acetyltransferase)
MFGSAFTVTSLGAYGIDLFPPIINPPQAAIVVVRRIFEQSVQRDRASLGEKR